MKYKFLKLSSFLTSAFLMMLVSSCVKENKLTFTDFSQVNDLVILQNSGLSNFSASAVVIGPATPDTLDLDIFAALASVNAVGSDIKVTIAVDDTKRTDYNAANGTSYLPFTSDMFKLLTGTVTIPAGQHYAKGTLELYSQQFDPTQSYMLPISITDASGKSLTSNQNTIYFHLIGNPLAGPYNVAGTRYNYSGSIGYAGGPIPAGYVSTAASPTPKFAAPLSPTVIALDYANLGGNGYQYVVTYNSTTNQITVAANSTLAAAVSNFTVFVQTYNPATKTIHILSSYNNGANGSGSDRIIDETFTHQ